MKDTSQAIIWPTSKGNVMICAFCTPEEIRSYVFDPQFGTHAHFKSLYTRRESLEKNALRPDANVVLALADIDHIIGFGVLAYPEPGERWAKLAPHLMMEVKAVEVGWGWRSAGVAGGIIKMLLAPPMIEDKILFLVGYSWTWDIDGTQKSVQQYREMLIRLFEPYGFKQYQTNEPNICLRPENLLLARIGKHVTREQYNNFKWLRYGAYADAPMSSEPSSF